MRLANLLSENRNKFRWIFPDPFTPDKGLKISLENISTEVDIDNMYFLDELISGWLQEHNKLFAFGGYSENRHFYKRSKIFRGAEVRTIHLGTDFWLPAGTQILMPIDGIVNSFKDNEGRGNYGPTIITSHQINNREFFLLWGHLSKKSLEGLKVNKTLDQGQTIGYIGDYSENGEWPPHLHLQIIIDLNDNYGDYPGVAAPSDAMSYLDNCPDPEMLFKLD